MMIVRGVMETVQLASIPEIPFQKEGSKVNFKYRLRHKVSLTLHGSWNLITRPKMSSMI